MFGRRMFSSSRIPQAMFHSLNISSRRQAAHVLPSLVVVPPLFSKCPGAALGMMTGGSGSCTSLSDDALCGDFATAACVEDVLAVLVAELWRPCGVNMAIWLRLNLAKSTPL